MYNKVWGRDRKHSPTFIVSAESLGRQCIIESVRDIALLIGASVDFVRICIEKVPCDMCVAYYVCKYDKYGLLNMFAWMLQILLAPTGSNLGSFGSGLHQQTKHMLHIF